MKTFCFTVDDNIRFLKDLTEQKYTSIFDHPYLAMYKRLHDAFGLKVQLNLFYQMEGFQLSQMSASYYSQWEENADWLKLSFHSDRENVRPYETSGYDEVYRDCQRVNREIVRFASPSALAKTTTIHYCYTTAEGLKALVDNQVQGLLGLFGSEEAPRTSYSLEEEYAQRIRSGETVACGKVSVAAIHVILNKFSKAEILAQLEALMQAEDIRVMIHEQYFYPDFRRYQPDFEEKLAATFGFLKAQGYQSCHFEERI